MSKICQKCHKEFSSYIIIEGKKRNLCNRKFCLDCSPFGEHNTSNIINEMQTEFLCPLCNKSMPKENFYNRYNSRKKVFTYCKNCMNTLTLKKQQKLKQQCIDYKGGKCSICGYCKFNSALEFHHLDPSLKEFSISKACNKKFENIINELDKCILVCRNCHAELHAITINGGPARI